MYGYNKLYSDMYARELAKMTDDLVELNKPMHECKFYKALCGVN